MIARSPGASPRRCTTQGAELAFTFQGEALGKRVRPLADSIGSEIVMDCDVTDEASLDGIFATLAKEWERLDFVVHAIAFSDKDELKGRYVDTHARPISCAAWTISCYSFTDICRRAVPLMSAGGSLLTLTYLGAERVMPHYNVMGVAKAALEASVRYLAVDLGGQNIRVNAISAGPIKTLAALGDRRLPLHPEVEPVQLAAEAQRHASRRSAAPASIC